MSLRRRLFDIIQPDQGDSWGSRLFDWTISALILVCVAIAFMVTFDLPGPLVDALLVVEKVASVVFTVEYLLRILTADFLFPDKSPFVARGRYVLSPMAVVDLLAILPFWLPMFLPCSLLVLRALRLVRLLRILKLNRYFNALRTIGDVLSDKRRELIGSLFFVGLLMLVSSLLMYSVEHDAQPAAFRNAFSGLWWAVCTLTTVGYGDVYPVTVLGRVLGAFIAFFGIAALAIPTGIVTAGLTARLGTRKDREQDDELVRQQKKDDEHDRLLREHGELLRKHGELQKEYGGLLREYGDQLKEISEKLSKLSSR